MKQSLLERAGLQRQENSRAVAKVKPSGGRFDLLNDTIGEFLSEHE